MKPATSWRSARSRALASRAPTARTMRARLAVPIVQGGHWPQASLSKKRARESAMASGETEAPTTRTEAVPRAEPAPRSVSGWSGVSSCVASSGAAVEELGKTMDTPSGVPSPCCSISRETGVPSATSYTPGRRTSPQRETSVVSVRRKPSGSARAAGTRASVSTFWTRVGRPWSPWRTAPARRVITKRSLIEPGSPSAPLAITTGSPSSTRTACHFRAAGNQPPPRPRRLAAWARRTSSGPSRPARPPSSARKPSLRAPHYTGLTSRAPASGVRLAQASQKSADELTSKGRGRAGARDVRDEGLGSRERGERSDDQPDRKRGRQGQGHPGAGEAEHSCGWPADLCPGRRLLGLLLRHGARRARRRRPGHRGRGREGHHRPHEPALPRGGRGRLQGRPDGRRLRDQEPERHLHLRLRPLLHGGRGRRLPPALSPGGGRGRRGWT